MVVTQSMNTSLRPGDLVFVEQFTSLYQISSGGISVELWTLTPAILNIEGFKSYRYREGKDIIQSGNWLNLKMLINCLKG